MEFRGPHLGGAPAPQGWFALEQLQHQSIRDGARHQGGGSAHGFAALGSQQGGQADDRPRPQPFQGEGPAIALAEQAGLAFQQHQDPVAHGVAGADHLAFAESHEADAGPKATLTLLR